VEKIKGDRFIFIPNIVIMAEPRHVYNNSAKGSAKGDEPQQDRTQAPEQHSLPEGGETESPARASHCTAGLLATVGVPSRTSWFPSMRRYPHGRR
jgi:hypothetical protein